MFWIKVNHNIINIIVSYKISFGTDRISSVHLNLTDAVFHDCQDAFIWCWLMQVGTTLAADCWIPLILFCFSLNLLHSIKQDQNINISIIWGWGLRAYTSDSFGNGGWCHFRLVAKMYFDDSLRAHFLWPRSMWLSHHSRLTFVIIVRRWESHTNTNFMFKSSPCHPGIILFSC